MDAAHETRPIRQPLNGWKTITLGDNDVEILEHQIEVTDFAEAAHVANQLAPLVMRYEPLDSGYAIRVNLTRWVVECRLSVPTGYWESEAQQKLAQSIAELSYPSEDGDE